MKIKKWYQVLFQISYWFKKKLKLKNQLPKLSNEEFAIFIDMVVYTYWQFCFNKIGHAKIGGKTYKNFIFIWNLVLVSFLYSYLNALGTIFDKPSYGNGKGTLSIFRMNVTWSSFDDKDKKTIRRILKARNKRVAHLDAETIKKHVNQGEGLLVSFELDPKGKDIERLFKKIFSLINEQITNYNYPYLRSAEQEQARVGHEFDKWFNNFFASYSKQ